MKKSKLHLLIVTAITGLAASTAPHVAAQGDIRLPQIREMQIIEINNGNNTDPEGGLHFAQATSTSTPPAPPTPPSPPTPPTPPGGHVIERRIVAHGPRNMDIDVMVSHSIAEAFASLPGRLGGQVVKNAPYSAEVINERIQWLPDGNQIVKRTSQMTFRDSAGRTRTEVRDDNGEVQQIRINDAIEKTRIKLTPKTRVAAKTTMDGNLEKHIAELREKALAAAKDGKSTVVTRGPGEEIVIKRFESPKEGGGTEVKEQVIVKAIRKDGGDATVTVRKGAAGNDATPGKTKMMVMDGGAHGHGHMRDHDRMGSLDALGALGMPFNDRAWSAKATTRELGSKDIDGIRVEGKMRSYTIPAGEIGNKNAISVTTETWTSPELQITVYSKHSDPRSGETVYKLAHLKRTEQPLTLFSIPDGYAVRDEPGLMFKSK